MNFAIGDKVRIGGGSDYEGRVGTLVAIEEGDVLWPDETYRVQLDSDYPTDPPVHCGWIEPMPPTPERRRGGA